MCPTQPFRDKKNEEQRDLPGIRGTAGVKDGKMARPPVRLTAAFCQ